MGMGARLRAPGIIQDSSGLDIDTPIQITRVRPGGKSFKVEAEEMLVKIFDPQDVTNRVILLNPNGTNLNLLTIHNSLYPRLTAADVAAGVNLKVIIVANAKITATSTNFVAFQVPTGWPAGFPIEIEIWGRIHGAGGKGANSSFDGSDGGRGGQAMRIRFPVSIRFKSGSRVWGGGGGGAGGGSARYSGPAASSLARGGAGGGGAGNVPGAKGKDPGNDGNAGTESSRGGPGSGTGAPRVWSEAVAEAMAATQVNRASTASTVRSLPAAPAREKSAEVAMVANPALRSTASAS